LPGAGDDRRGAADRRHPFDQPAVEEGKVLAKRYVMA
jgi:glucose-6-phosphate isomerase